MGDDDTVDEKDWTRTVFDFMQSTRTAGDTLMQSATDHALDAVATEDTNAEILSTIAMEEMMPLKVWTKMRMDARHGYLDQFYPVRQKYVYEREGASQCLEEQLLAHECNSKRGSFSDLFDSKKPWLQRLNACATLSEKHKRCVTMMTMAKKTKHVFGTDAHHYLRIIDKETLGNIHEDPLTVEANVGR